MIISVNWLKKFTDITLPVDELAELIGARLVEIEGIEDLGAKYKDVLVAKVVECKPVEGSDHLSVTKIDDGGKAKGVERDKDGLVQVVCGAPNVREGLMVAWLPPNSVIPETAHDTVPVTLAARELRGHTSNGMLASSRELGLNDEHDGILEIDKPAKPGVSFAKLYELDDYLLDIENKSLTHRPDTFGVIGFAREVAGIQGKAFATPDWLVQLETADVKTDDSLSLKVSIDNPELSARYQAVVLSGANEMAVSPIQLQTYLSRSGVRPISAVVDVTNYLMLLAGQPLHAFDYDKVAKLGRGTADIHVRGGRKGETLNLLDGRTIELSEEDIVIAASDVAIGLAGAMGGADTEIDDSTKNIILESATFNLYNLRATQMRHGIFSEAITRFTKGQPAGQTAPVIGEAVRMLGKLSGAQQVTAIADAYPEEATPTELTITQAKVNNVLGSELTSEQIATTLQNVGFIVDAADNTLTITAPYWRTDIHIEEDIIEEVGRLNGFDSIAPVLPSRDFTAVRPDDFDQLRAQLRQLLVRAGANEVLTYSFVHGDLMKKAGQNPDTAYRIVNSISPELQYYRQSLTPSLLVNVHPNAKAGYDHFALFEFNKFHTKLHEVTEEGVPKEVDGLAFVVASQKKSVGAAYYEAKQYIDYIATALNLDLVYEPLEEKSDYPVTQPFEYRRSARIWDRATRERVGVIGEFKKSVQKAFKLSEHTAGFELSPRALLKLAQSAERAYRPLSKFPSTERDITIQTSGETTYQQVRDVVDEIVSSQELSVTVEPVGLYVPDENTKNVTLRLKIVAYDRTLSSDDANQLVEAVTEAVVAQLGAKIV